MERYAADLDNVRAALEWTQNEAGGSHLAVALAGAGGPLWPMLSLYGEGVQRLEAALARVDTSTPSLDAARLWLWFGIAVQPAGTQRALEAFECAAALYSQESHPLEHGHAWVRLAFAFVTINELERAARTLRRSRPAVERADVPKLNGLYHAAAGFLALQRGNSPSARAEYEAALRQFRTGGNDLSALACIGSYANLCWTTRDLVAAETAFREAIELARASRSAAKGLLGFALAHLAGVLTERGDASAAMAAAREGLPMLADMGNAWRLMDHLALLAALRGNTEGAARIAGFADASYARNGTPREPNESRARAQLLPLLRAHVPPGDLQRLLAAGATLSQRDACEVLLAT
jgi:tetratricopeptide (TPR) repeat protein